MAISFKELAEDAEAIRKNVDVAYAAWSSGDMDTAVDVLRDVVNGCSDLRKKAYRLYGEAAKQVPGLQEPQ